MLILSCQRPAQESSAAHLSEIEEWSEKRWNDLRSEDGWLNLAGLFWLSEGINSFGSAPDEPIRFPEGFPLAHAGYITLSGGIVRLTADPGNGIEVNGQRVGEALLFHPDSADVVYARSGSYRWNIIRREDKFGIRLRNLDSAYISKFTKPERFPVDPTLKVLAKFVAYNAGHTIAISNVLGQTTNEPSPGKLEFTIDGNNLTLDALLSGDELFIVFADATSGNETYGGGRFLYVKKPGPDGPVTIDFNKAINPPCVFSEFATCPLPPKQNRLLVPVRAGEKNIHY
ncbi:MAG: DUF1684 domain-containing protein [Bacteroidota bacterium]